MGEEEGGIKFECASNQSKNLVPQHMSFLRAVHTMHRAQWVSFEATEAAAVQCTALTLCEQMLLPQQAVLNAIKTASRICCCRHCAHGCKL